MVTRKQNTDFGMVLTLVLLVVGIFRHIQLLYVLAIFSLLITSLIPMVFTPLSWVWFRVGKIVEICGSMVILTLVFYIVVTPLGLLRKLFAKDELQLRSFKRNKKSVFIVRNTTYQKEDLENQF